MVLRDTGFDELLAKLKPTSRRSFLKRSVAMAATLPAFGTLLSACGGDDDDDSGDPTATSAPAGDEPTATEQMADEEATATEEMTDGEPTATEEMADEEPTATEEMADEEPTATEAASGGGDEPVDGGVFVALGHHEVASLSPDDWGPAVHYFIVGNII